MKPSPSLRTRITAAFLIIVVGGAAVSTLIGSRIITQALLEQARTRVRHGLQAARSLYDEELERVRVTVSGAATHDSARAGLCTEDPGRRAESLAGLRASAQLDFLDLWRPPATHAPTALQQLLLEARNSEAIAASTVLSPLELARVDPALVARAHIPIVAVPKAAPDSRTEIGEGLTLVGAAPVLGPSGFCGVLYGGVLLNHSYAVVDKVKRLVFGDATHLGRDIGAVSIFLTDVRISTNVLNLGRHRAVGTRASAQVAAAVLARRQTWIDRAFVVTDWYVSAYEPIHDRAGRVVGMLYVGLLEAPYLAARTDVMLTFLVVAALGVAIVFLLTYLITRSMIRPLEQMVIATDRIARGDLNQRVEVPSRDEIGRLAAAFNRMVVSLRAMRLELQTWAHTLEEKVRERTNELVTMQAQMRQAEKLASVGRLAAGVAHEINNPLGGILSIAMLDLEACDPGHPLRADLELIVRQTMRCREIVKGLLEFSRQSESQATEVDVNSTVESTLQLLERQASFHNVKILKDLQRDLPPVMIDPSHLQQMIINIVLNAVDAMEENGDLGIETCLDADGHKVVIRIRDTGKGIPEDVLPLIFEPFFTTKKVGRGTGLGLAIVHGIVTRAGGGIWVESSPAGTVVTVALPAAAAGAQG